MKEVILSPVQKFIKAESFSGFILFAATILALVLANIPGSNFYQDVLSYKIGFQSEGFTLVKPVILWINDGLMAIFFFLVGLEIKREILLGELNSMKKASLPIFAAIGGMIVPLVLYFWFNNDPEASKGWGISMATDIAFTLAILKLLGNRVPLSLKIFLTAFAIIDDIGAVIVIALFYTSQISWVLLLYAGLLLALIFILSYFKIHSRFILIFLGVIIWVLFLKAGIHPTIAGILLAFSVPVKQKINEFDFAVDLKDILNRLLHSSNTNKLPVLTKQQMEELEELEELTNKVQSPLQQLEHRLHKWVAYLIMPIFALANAGIELSSDSEINTALVFTVSGSLFLGKTLGVLLFSWISIRLKISDLPQGVSLTHILGIAILSGVGFTMSLFIGSIAFSESLVYLNSAKVGIIVGSVFAGLLGYLVLRFTLPKLKTQKQA